LRFINEPNKTIKHISLKGLFNKDGMKKILSEVSKTVLVEMVREAIKEIFSTH
jgi:hypothetical protein